MVSTPEGMQQAALAGEDLFLIATWDLHDP